MGLLFREHFFMSRSQLRELYFCRQCTNLRFCVHPPGRNSFKHILEIKEIKNVLKIQINVYSRHHRGVRDDCFGGQLIKRNLYSITYVALTRTLPCTVDSQIIVAEQTVTQRSPSRQIMLKPHSNKTDAEMFTGCVFRGKHVHVFGLKLACQQKHYL